MTGLSLTAEERRKLEAVIAPTRAVRVRKMSDITVRPVDWLWRNRIALGKINQLAGAPGQGKSQLTCLIAAMVTTGQLEGELFGDPRHIVIASAEDDPEDTITPRLLAADADPDKVHILDMRVGMLGREVTSALRLPQDALPVIDAMKDLNAALLVLDPIAAMLQSDRSAHTNQHVRDALDLIRADAAERHYAVILVQHLLTKALAGTDALARLADSHAFAGLPRVIQYLTPHPDDEEGERGRRKLLTIPKANIVPPGQHALEFRLDGETVDVDETTRVETSRIVLVGEVSDLSTEDGLLTSEERGDRQAAKHFLREWLEDGEAYGEDVNKDSDFSERTLRRARKDFVYWRRTADNKTVWGLVEHEDVKPGPTDPPMKYADSRARAKKLGHLATSVETDGVEPETARPRVGHIPPELGHIPPGGHYPPDGQVANGEAKWPTDVANEGPVSGSTGGSGQVATPYAREAPGLNARLGDHPAEAFTDANRTRRESAPTQDDKEQEEWWQK